MITLINAQRLCQASFLYSFMDVMHFACPPDRIASSLEILSTSSFASLPFSQTYLFCVFHKSLVKISQGFKKLFQKDRFKHELFFLLKKFSIVRTPTSVTKMIFVSTDSMYLTETLLISLNPQKFFLAGSNAESHSFFIWVEMFNLTIFWARKTVFSFSKHRNLVNIRRRIIR